MMCTIVFYHWGTLPTRYFTKNSNISPNFQFTTGFRLILFINWMLKIPPKWETPGVLQISFVQAFRSFFQVYSVSGLGFILILKIKTGDSKIHPPQVVLPGVSSKKLSKNHVFLVGRDLYNFWERRVSDGFLSHTVKKNGIHFLEREKYEKYRRDPKSMHKATITELTESSKSQICSKTLPPRNSSALKFILY